MNRRPAVRHWKHLRQTELHVISLMNHEDFNKELNLEANISLYEFELRCVRTGGLRGQWHWMDPVEPHRHTVKPS